MLIEQVKKRFCVLIQRCKPKFHPCFYFFLRTDIQEFYEFTLLDESKSTQQKTLETLQIASKWEREPPITTVTQPKIEVIIRQSQHSGGVPNYASRSNEKYCSREKHDFHELND